ncbi:MAG: hypothetical protein JJD93_11765 [Ilumatobacteraceae bacterium]|nr:hypothetical protein [Ilumatobacteraceae bacterium]
MTLVLEDPQQNAGGDVDSPPTCADRFPTRPVIVAILVSIGLRARFITTPLSSDEGGYLAVARAWASGKSLYTEAWVDRPQGLLVLFRIWDDLTGGSAEAIRVMAIVFGCVAVVAVAYAVFAIAGPRAGAIAAFLVAVASANARIEGFIANGELLAGAVAAAGLAAACGYMFRGHGPRWLFVSGVLAGCAMSLKQSGFDGFVAVMICLLVGGLTRERRWRDVLRECAVCVAGWASVMAALLLHGIILGFSAWWYALAGYRIGGLNAADADWHRFGITSRLAAPTILPLAAAAVIGVIVWLPFHQRITRKTVLIPAWMCFAVASLLTGGLFHRHYWVTLTFPFAAAAAVAIGKIKSHVAIPIAVATLIVIPSLISTERVIVLDRAAVAIKADDDPRLVVDERVARWYTDNRTPGSTLYALCASAAMYAAADAIPPYPYLWLDGVQHGRRAQDQLVQLFAGDNPPTFVARYQAVRVCNPSGEVGTLLNDRYRQVEDVDGAIIYELRDPVPNS